jgi:hypothetical protein
MEAEEATIADLRSTTRRSLSNRRGTERRGGPYRSQTIVAHADEDRAVGAGQLFGGSNFGGVCWTVVQVHRHD